MHASKSRRGLLPVTAMSGLLGKFNHNSSNIVCCDHWHNVCTRRRHVQQPCLILRRALYSMHVGTIRLGSLQAFHIDSLHQNERTSEHPFPAKTPPRISWSSILSSSFFSNLCFAAVSTNCAVVVVFKYAKLSRFVWAIMGGGTVCHHTSPRPRRWIYTRVSYNNDRVSLRSARIRHELFLVNIEVLWNICIIAMPAWQRCIVYLLVYHTSALIVFSAYRATEFHSVIFYRIAVYSLITFWEKMNRRKNKKGFQTWAYLRWLQETTCLPASRPEA